MAIHLCKSVATSEVNNGADMDATRSTASPWPLQYCKTLKVKKITYSRGGNKKNTFPLSNIDKRLVFEFR